MNTLILLLIKVSDIYLWMIILSVVISWLVVFDVLNTRNKWVYKFCELLNRLTNPVVMKLRKYIPPLGGVDLTPMIMIFGIYLIQDLLYKICGVACRW